MCTHAHAWWSLPRRSHSSELKRWIDTCMPGLWIPQHLWSRSQFSKQTTLEVHSRGAILQPWSPLANSLKTWGLNWGSQEHLRDRSRITCSSVTVSAPPCITVRVHWHRHRHWVFWILATENYVVTRSAQYSFPESAFHSQILRLHITHTIVESMAITKKISYNSSAGCNLWNDIIIGLIYVW